MDTTRHLKDDHPRLRRQIDHGLEEIERLRDEIRVRIHLAEMDARDEWARLEPYVYDVERRAGQTTRAARDAVHDAIERLRKLGASF